MQYSSVNGQKSLPFPKGKGICEICDSVTIAKCGKKIMWHWAHKTKKDCDLWWENETEWHREWKEQFPEKFREVVHKCKMTGEKHRADIKSDNGIILEIQNSPISLDELQSREKFYKNLIWIVNGEKFIKRFTIFSNLLPNPNSKEFEDIVFVATSNHNSCTMFWRLSENPNVLNSNGNQLVEMYSTRKLQKLINKHYVGHHPFYWKRPHISWVNATCPVFIDFGTDILWRIENYKNHFTCVRAVVKKKVILDVINKTKVQDIADDYTI
jgi:competence protein CoiA